MRKGSFSLALFVTVGLLTTIPSERSILAQQRPANGPVPLERLSDEQRGKTSPDSTLVQFRNKTFTLGQLRAAHQARTVSFPKAQASGALIAQNLINQKPSLVSAKTGTVAGHVNVTQPQPPADHRPVIANTGGIRDLTAAQWVTEPASDYAKVPADMKAFCAAAGASACLYLPPQQQIEMFQGSAADSDSLINQSQCQSEGGGWMTFGWGVYVCEFFYPQSVTVRFTPPPNYQISSTAQCDQSVFSYQVDTHGAVSISIKQSGFFTTGSSPWCVVKVKLGS